MTKKSEVKRKAERPKRKAIAKPEEKHSAPDSYRDDIPHSALKETPTANSNPDSYREQTKKMEVHHHPDVEKKGFKEYILEGLMIFLAVMMGFIAENIRESISEHKRAAEFARSYYEDIKKDTSQLYGLIKSSKHKIRACDSTVAALHLPDNLQRDTIKYREGQITSNVFPFHPSSGSYEQIKSSGSLRFFKQKMVNLMNDYDLQAKQAISRDDIDMKFIVDQYIPFIMRLNNVEVGYDFRFSAKTTHEMYVADRSLSTKRIWINYIVVAKLLRMRSMQEYTRLLDVSGKVLVELKSEYSLEDE